MSFKLRPSYVNLFLFAFHVHKSIHEYYSIKTFICQLPSTTYLLLNTLVQIILVRNGIEKLLPNLHLGLKTHRSETNSLYTKE